MKRIQTAEAIGPSSKYVILWRLEPLVIPVLYVVFLGLALFVESEAKLISSIFLPLALGFGILIGQRLLLRGVVIVLIVLMGALAACLLFSLGPFSASIGFREILYGIGLLITFPLLSFLSALMTGYHRRAAEVAEGREAMLNKVFDALPIGIWVRARSGVTVFANERWVSFISAPGNEGEAALDFGYDWQAEGDSILDSDDSTIRYRAIELTDKHGQKCSMTLFTLRVYIDELKDFGILCLLIDETAVRLYEARTRDSEYRLRMALDNTEMGYWEQDVESDQVSTDINCMRMLGVDTSNALDNEALWTELIHPDDVHSVLGSRQSLLDGDIESLNLDYRIRNFEGNYLWVLDRMHVASRDSDGEVKRIFGTIEDISERKQFEIDLKHAKNRAESANQAKGHFLATISHEIRTPLNAIIGLSSFLAESEMDAEQKDLVDTIHSSGQNLLYLVNDILDFSKIEAGRLELEVQEYPIRLCFEDCVKLFKMRAAEKNVDLSLNLDHNISEFALGDMERLRQIVQNLLANALKFTDHGSVEVSVRRIDLGELPDGRRPEPLMPTGYLDQPEHDYIQIQVKDTGIGIPKKLQYELFEAFSQADPSTTRKYGGTGLGLAICKRLVEAMGGDIWVESTEGNGAVFCFVVRSILIYEDSIDNTAVKDDFDVEQRIASSFPCDILVVGSKELTESLLLACRQLGYVPHRSLEYSLTDNALIRRKYGIVFICMGDEVHALKLSRRIASASNTHRPKAIVGFGAGVREISEERRKLAGMHHWIDGMPQAEVIRAKILEVLDVSD